MRFALIDAEKADVPVRTACAVLGVSASGYYAWKSREASPRQRHDMILLAHIRSQFSTSNETYGSPRMHVELNEDGSFDGCLSRSSWLPTRPASSVSSVIWRPSPRAKLLSMSWRRHVARNGRVRQAALRRAHPSAGLSEPLHAPDRHFQPAADLGG